MTATETISRQPNLGVITGKWVFIAGLFGIVLQLAWCLHENLFDERYFSRHFIVIEAERLIQGAKFEGGKFQALSESSLERYRGEHAAAYGFRIVDAKDRILAQSNEPLVAASSPLSSPSGRPDFWQRKIGPGWFEVSGGIRRRVGEHDLWIEVATLGDPQRHRLSALAAEIVLDVWTPLAPTLLLTTLLAIVAVRRALGPLSLAAERAQVLDVRQALALFDTTGLPREAANFATAINRLIVRVRSLVRSQETLLACVAHELGSRLAVLLLELNRITEKPARRLEGDVADMSVTVQQLLTLARMELSPPSQKPEAVDLETIANLAIAQVAPLAESRSCCLSLTVDRPEPFLGDFGAVLEAVRNATENAIKHGPDRNKVQIGCGPGRAITIDDSGPGLMTDDVERLFGPFERGDTTAPGSGLGLAIVKAAVDLHRGSVETGRSPSGGARFTLRFASLQACDERNSKPIRSTVGANQGG